MDRNHRRCFDSQPDLTTFDPEYDHPDVRADRDTFSTSTAEYQHTGLPWQEA
jgi:hypothetical protein